MDKWEIGQPIVQEILIDVLWSLKNHVDKSEFGVEVCHFNLICYLF